MVAQRQNDRQDRLPLKQHAWFQASYNKATYCYVLYLVRIKRSLTVVKTQFILIMPPLLQLHQK